MAPHSDCPPNAQSSALSTEIASLCKSKAVEAKFWGCYRISSLAPNVCRVSLVMNTDMGSIPRLAAVWVMQKMLVPVARMLVK
jgi:hypothetical protein